MRRAEEDGATLMICSDHGFKWDEDRTCRRSSLNWATAAFWHRLNGVLLLWGKNVKGSPERGDASVYDVAPTVSALLELPVDPKMQGKALLELPRRSPKMQGKALLSAFQGVSSPPREVFRNVEVRRCASNAPTAAQRSEYAEKLRSLGYLSGSESKSLPVADREETAQGRTEGAWNNLGLYQREAGLLDEAERSFRESLRLKPDYSSPMFNLAVLERTRGRWEPALEWLFKSLAAGRAEPEETLLQSVYNRDAGEAKVIRGRDPGTGHRAVSEVRKAGLGPGPSSAGRKRLPGRSRGSQERRGNGEPGNPRPPRPFRDVPRAPGAGAPVSRTLAGPRSRSASDPGSAPAHGGSLVRLILRKHRLCDGLERDEHVALLLQDGPVPAPSFVWNSKLTSLNRTSFGSRSRR